MTWKMPKMKDNINRNTAMGWWNATKNSYTNLMYYTSASWIDENNLRGERTCQDSLDLVGKFLGRSIPNNYKLSASDADSHIMGGQEIVYLKAGVAR